MIIIASKLNSAAIRCGKSYGEQQAIGRQVAFLAILTQQEVWDGILPHLSWYRCEWLPPNGLRMSRRPVRTTSIYRESICQNTNDLERTGRAVGSMRLLGGCPGYGCLKR